MRSQRTLLLVEDNEELTEQLVPQLKEAGYRCLVAPTLRMGRMLLERQAEIELVLLDISLPDGSGLDLLRELRNHMGTPVIMLTARDFGPDKVQALDWGADDYITKPFWIEELLARLRAVERRAQQDPTSSTRFAVGTMQIDTHALELHMGGESIALTPTHWGLLTLFLARKGQPTRRDRLKQAITEDHISDEALHAHISRLRKRLGTEGWRIETIWGIGYRFNMKDPSP